MGLESVHLRELAEGIGPRPAGTDAEAKAADYLETAFIARGLEVERQEFMTPRTYAWAYVIYHLLTLVAVGASYLKVLRWPAVVLAALVAVVMWLDLDTRGGLSGLMPKSPSQNIIARHVPRARRGERVRRVIVVAHYDSARASLAFSPGMAKNFSVTFLLLKVITFGVPLLLVANALPLPAWARPWTWYAAVAFSAYLLVPLFINIHREFFMPHVDGANDNASGVAAMLGVMDRIVPEAETFDRPEAQPTRRGEDEAWAADVVPDGAVLSYAPSETQMETGSRYPDLSDDWGDIDGEPTSSRAPLSHDLDIDEATGSAPPLASAEPAAPAPAGTGGEDRGVSDWLGLGRGFDARKKGREIGTWDNFAEDDDDDAGGLGWKGGSAPYDEIDDPDFAASEAARIRRKVTEHADRELVEKELWFVATGAEEVGTVGMRAFLDAYREEAEDAVIINIDGVGSGNVHYITSEGMARHYHCDRRLASAAKRVVREEQLPIRDRVYHLLSTDATPALARGFRAMSVMAFDINGRISNWHWKTDTTDSVSEETIDLAADFVTKLIRGL